jgi:hypothetical protein
MGKKWSNRDYSFSATAHKLELSMAMKGIMELKNGLGHLSYSTLVHLGDTWAEMNASLREFVPQVKKRISPDAPFAVSLRISASSAKTLTDSPTERKSLAEFLAAEDLYVYTVNAFPYGPFKGEIVMERVYEPDWTTDDRVNYTNSVADILAEITPKHINPSIQTAPLASSQMLLARNTSRLLLATSFAL